MLNLYWVARFAEPDRENEHLSAGNPIPDPSASLRIRPVPRSLFPAIASRYLCPPGAHRFRLSMSDLRGHRVLVQTPWPRVSSQIHSRDAHRSSPMQRPSPDAHTEQQHAVTLQQSLCADLYADRLNTDTRASYPH